MCHPLQKSIYEKSNRRRTVIGIFILGCLLTSSPASAGQNNAETTLPAFKAVQQAILGTFELDTLDILVVDCPTANAYAAPGKVYICLQHINKLRDASAGNRETLTALLMFTIMHEVGHVLADAWQLPGQGNEELTDELATVLMIMFSQGEGIEPSAAYLESLGDASDSNPGHYPDFKTRADNLRRWGDNPATARAWQPLLTPHFRGRVLSDLYARPRPWSDDHSLSAEILVRGID